MGVNVYNELLWVFLVALVVSFLLTPLAIRLAPRIGAMDVPKDDRRMHTKAMPRFGGLAIYGGTMVAMAIFLNFDKQVLTVMAGGTLIYLLGVVDDLKDLNPKVKFAGQTLVAILMYACGLRIEFLRNIAGPGNVTFGAPVCFVITVLWIVGITNAVNLIDGLDGLAAGTSAIAALCLAYVGYIFGSGHYLPTAAMLALAGAALGFLPWNFYPAKIFMGDGGSQFLGFMLATLSVLGLTKSAAVIATAVPVLVLGLPIFDTFFAIFRRLVNKQPIMTADKGHLHHRLMRLGYGQRRATLMIYGISAIMGVAAVLFSRGLRVEGFGLVAVAGMDIYIFLTDPNHVLPQIKQEDGARETTKAPETPGTTETPGTSETSKEPETTDDPPTEAGEAAGNTGTAPENIDGKAADDTAKGDDAGAPAGAVRADAAGGTGLPLGSAPDEAAGEPAERAPDHAAGGSAEESPTGPAGGR